MNMNCPADAIDHTLLHPAATRADILNLCEEAVEFGFASVCIPPVYVPLAVECLYGSAVQVCSVVGFPCGYQPPRQKVLEATDLVAAGADEIDMVVHLGAIMDDLLPQLGDEIVQVTNAVRPVGVKVILECCYLKPDQMRAVSEEALRAGAAFVKTSTGFGSAGATLEAVALLAEWSVGRIGIKAAGGIRTLDECQAFLAAGATRIGTSSGVSIMQQWQQRADSGLF